jgi:hypothetical protein
MSAEAWQQVPLLARIVPSAAQKALNAEYDSSTCHIGDPPAGEVRTSRRILKAKSVRCGWILALAPMCLRGWPPYLRPARYYRCLSRFGVFVQWVDDIADLLGDLESGTWSDVLLTLHARTDRPYESRTDFAADVLAQLASETVRSELAMIGRNRLDAFLLAVDGLGIYAQPLRRAFNAFLIGASIAQKPKAAIA